MENNNILEKISKALEDKKAIDIKILDTKDKTTVADYFVIASGTSNVHIKALSDNVEYVLKKENIPPYKVEGYKSNTWILMDYSSIIVNIFTEEQREYYNLEELWEKARNKE